MVNVSTTELFSSKKYWLSDCSAADAVSCCSAGNLIQDKQLSLRLAWKSMTGSEKMLTLMNRYGHWGNSETTQGVDMSLESTFNNSYSFIPDVVKTKLNLSTWSSLLSIKFMGYDIKPLKK